MSNWHKFQGRDLHRFLSRLVIFLDLGLLNISGGELMNNKRRKIDLSYYIAEELKLLRYFNIARQFST